MTCIDNWFDGEKVCELETASGTFISRIKDVMNDSRIQGEGERYYQQKVKAEMRMGTKLWTVIQVQLFKLRSTVRVGRKGPKSSFFYQKDFSVLQTFHFPIKRHAFDLLPV